MCVCVCGGGGLGHRDMQRIVLSLKFMISAFLVRTLANFFGGGSTV